MKSTTRLGKAAFAMMLLALVAPLQAAVAGGSVPVLDLEFDESNGSTAENAGSLGAGSNGTVSGATYSTDSASASGFSLRFDGDTDFVEVADTFDYGSTVTVEAWIKPEKLEGPVAIYDDYGNPGVFLALFDDKLEWNISTTAHPGLGIAIFDGKLCPNLWQHVAGTYDGAMLRAYVNGTEVGSVATAGAIADNSTNATHIGADSASPNALEFQGRIDAVRVYLDAIAPPPFLLCGELTGDCSITSIDALGALRIAVGLAGANAAANVDGGTAVTATDAFHILRIAVGLEAQTNDCNKL